MALPATSEAAVETATLSTTEGAQVEITNPYKLTCPACGSCIVPVGAAERVQKQIVAHVPMRIRGEIDEGRAPTETLDQHWAVRDQFDFENVGVTRPVPGRDSYRYLLCADCDLGPIGIRYDADPSFYVFDDRVAKR